MKKSEIALLLIILLLGTCAWKPAYAMDYDVSPTGFISVPSFHPEDSLRWGVFAGMLLNTSPKSDYGVYDFGEIPGGTFFSICRFVPQIGFYYKNRHNDLHQLKISALPNMKRYYNSENTVIKQNQINGEYCFDISLVRSRTNNLPKLRPYLGFSIGGGYSYYYEDRRSGGAGSYHITQESAHSNTALLAVCPSLKYFSGHSSISLGFNLNMLGMTWNKAARTERSRDEWNMNWYVSHHDFQMHEFISINEFLNEGFLFRSIELNYCYLFR
jgi:hypothetical protein